MIADNNSVINDLQIRSVVEGKKGVNMHKCTSSKGVCVVKQSLNGIKMSNMGVMHNV